MYMDKVIAIISHNHDTENQQRMLNLIYQHITQRQAYPVERLISNIIDDIPLIPNRQTHYILTIGSIKKTLKIDYRPELPTLSEMSLKIMFKVLKISTVVDIFKNILFERGLFLIGKCRSIGFHIIEALTSLIFPLNWNFPKIASFGLNYHFFDSPLPLIYFVLSSQFNNTKIKEKQLCDKCLVYINGNTVEYDNANTPDLPKKALTRLIERLEESVGEYNKFYMNYKTNLVEDSQYDEEVCPAKFDYWGVRDAFLEFMQGITNKYEDCITLNKDSEFLQYKEIFD
jgi:hypothetical protein